jgi:UDP-N-acetylglucosamine 2-epimerase (non-hydrolysing)
MMIGAESQGLKALNGDLADFIERVKTQGRKLLLLTMHRRESQSGFIQDIVDKLIGIVERNKLAIVCIEHPNPNSKIQLKKETDGSFAFLSPSMPYDVFIELMKLSDLILTDSGGIQEEAPALGKAVLVLRQETERRECLDGIHWSLFDPKDLEASILRMLQKKAPINKAFGDGNASKRIVAVLKNLQGSQA